MAARVPMAPPSDDDSLVVRGPVPAHPGERAADQATELYIEQEHESRQARFERQVKRAAVHE